MPAYRFTPPRAKCSIVFFGGFDSYIEELTAAFVSLRDAGYDVIAFEGPGQGGALNDAGLTMTREWHKPLAAVLDYFDVEQVALVGLSLGGCLALRAAALEPRVAYVVAYDVLTNFFDVTLRQTSVSVRALLTVLLKLKAGWVVNSMVARVVAKSLVAQWGIQEGMNVTGTANAFEFFQRIKRFTTSDVSAAVGQDVLLLAGSEDHYVPLEQWYRRQLHPVEEPEGILITSEPLVRVPLDRPRGLQAKRAPEPGAATESRSRAQSWWRSSARP